MLRGSSLRSQGAAKIRNETPLRIAGEPYHFPELDGIRGLAILGVLIAHGVMVLGVMPHNRMGRGLATILVPGWGGVDLFFTLSGFLITGILLRARSRHHYFSSFYMRRILRIFPIYYLYLGACTIAAHFWAIVAAWLPVGFSGRFPFFIYLQNWPIFWPNWEAMPSIWGVFWSLAVEEQFYMIWPAVVRFIKLRALLIVCIVGFLLGWPERALMIHEVGFKFGIMQWPFSRLDGLFLGAAIAIYREIYGRVIPLRWATISFLVGAGFFVGLAIADRGQLASGNGRTLYEVAVTAFALMSGGLIVASQHRIEWLHRVLTARPLVHAGRLSYGMYVYHLMVYELITLARWRLGIGEAGPHSSLVRAIVYIAMSVLLVAGVAELSFRFIETPFLRLKRFFPSPAALVS